jgi:hypothetical protein
MRILDHARTNDFIAINQGERRPIVANPNTRKKLGRCPGCGGPMAQSHWSNAKREGKTFCHISCAMTNRGGGAA